MRSFTELCGSWAGVNGFRLMPGDDPHVAPATADVSTAAAGNLVVVAYTWSHPEDGAQDGLLVVGPNAEADGAAAFWADSWHQSPQPALLAGGFQDGVLVVAYEYGVDWVWRVTIDATDEAALVLRMENVVPASAATEAAPAGAYSAMLIDLRRN